MESIKQKANLKNIIVKLPKPEKIQKTERKDITF